MNQFRRASALLVLALLLGSSLGCNGNKAKTEAPAATPPSKVPNPSEVQQPNQPNPTGTPVGQKPADMPIDTPSATLEVPDGTPMGTDQEQAQALLNFVEHNKDAPGWTLTWETGKGKLTFDAVTGILQITKPDGTSAKYEKIDRPTLEAVAKGSRGWAG